MGTQGSPILHMEDMLVRFARLNYLLLYLCTPRRLIFSSV